MATAIAWNTTISGDWNTGTNWVGGAVPQPGTAALISPVGANYTVTVSTNDTIAAVTVNSPNATLEADGTLNATSTVTVTNGLLTALNNGTIEIGSSGLGVANVTGTTASVIINGTSALLSVSGGIGDGVNGTGLVEAINGGHIQLTGTSGINLGKSGTASAGTLLISGVGALFSDQAGINDGSNGSGLVEALNGGTIQLLGTNGIGLGVSASTGTGTLLVSGAGALFTEAAGINDGLLGSGLIGVTNGGTIALTGTNGIGLGVSAVASSGTLLVGGIGALLSMGTTAGDISVGILGSGTLDVATGGTIQMKGLGGLFIGDGGSGFGTVSGTGALISQGTAGGGIGVGEGSTGTLEVTNGGSIQLNGSFGIGIGELTGGSGTVVVSDSGSSINEGTLGNGIGVGNGTLSSGTLEVLNGATIQLNGTGRFSIANEATSTGFVEVSGAGSLINEGTAGNGMGIAGGTNSSGTLEVLNGGTVALNGTSNPNGVAIGQGTNAQGLVVVSGTQSLLSVNTPSGTLLVGVAGQGVLDVGAGGTVSVTGGGIRVGSASGGTGTISVSGTGALINDTGAFFVGNGGGGVLSVGSLGVVTATGSLGAGFDIGSGTGNGTVDINGGTLTEAGGGFFVGNTTASGTLTVEGLGTLITGAGGNFSDISATGGGTALATISNATWLSNGSIIVGDSSGSGWLDVNSNGLVNAGANSVIIANGATSSGTISVESGTVVVGTLTVASGTAASGTLAISGGTVDASKTLIIGRLGNGLVTVGTGGVLAAAGLVIDREAFGNGTLLVNGGTVTDSSTLSIGTGGTAIVTVGTGGTFSATGSPSEFDIGSASGGTAVVTVDHGMFATSGAPLYIGNGSSASVLVEHAGTIITTYDTTGRVIAPGVPVADINTSFGSQAIVTVTGTGSVWDINGPIGGLIVGDFQAGTLAVSAGGLVNTGTDGITIGNSTGGKGIVTVDGIGSELEGGNLVIAGKASSSGALSVSGSALVSVSSFSNQSGGTISLSSGTLFAGGGSLTPVNFGTIDGSGTLAATVNNFGTIDAESGRLVVTGSIGSTGSIDIGNGATLQASLGIGSGQSVTFETAGNPEALQLNTLTATESFSLSNWQNGDELIVGDASTVTGAQWLNGASLSGTLEVDTTGGTYDFTSVSLAAGSFPIFTTGTNFVELISCFAAGTRIATEGGEVAVENLREGDRVQVVVGEQAEPVIWIGYRKVDCRHHPKPAQVWPVRIAAGAFGPGRPQRDLWLSPDHAVYVEDVLIPVKYLINDRTITQVPMDQVTYYHVELPRHTVLLAEGLPAESYLDVGDRTNFGNGGAPIALYPDFASRVWEAEDCAPLVVTGSELEAVRQRVSVRASDMPGAAAAA